MATVALRQNNGVFYAVPRYYKQDQLAEKLILSSEKMLHKDYDRKGSVAKRKRLVVSP
jgi:hypothetical protein